MKNAIKHYITIIYTMVICLLPQHSFAVINITHEYNYYSIEASSIKEIQLFTLENSLTGPKGQHFMANTNFKLSWKYNFKNNENGCALESMDADVVFISKMPHATNYQNFNKNDKNEWDRFYIALYMHEKGHEDIITKNIQNLENTLLNIPAKESCGELARTANFIANNILESQHKENLLYDQATKHGMNQGAFLTP